MKTKIIQNIKSIILALILVAGVGVVSAVWNNPTATPSGNNTDAPLNVGSTAQTKTAGLTLSNLWLKGQNASGSVLANGLIVENGNVGIGVTSPAQKLDVNGTVKATGLQIGGTTGQVLLSGGTGNATWETVTGYTPPTFSSQFAYKRGDSYPNDQVIWCPANHPYIVSCNPMDDQAPPTPNDAGCSLSDGKCNTASVAVGSESAASTSNQRGSNGVNNIYLETVKSGTQYGCLAYSFTHTHTSYRLDLVCSE